MDCTIENRKQIALSKVVSASIIDTYGDINRLAQRNTHFAARGLRKLYSEVLPNIKHKVWLPVSKNTHTATLPIDFDKETFVGFIDKRWHKVPIRLNTSITDTINIVDVPCESPCKKCGQDTNICNDLVVTQETNLIVIGGTTYEQTIIKKLYPNGDYYLETSTPVPDINDDTNVTYQVTREFIVNFDLKPCGCLDTTPLNTANLQNYCPDIYCNYYAPCDSKCCTDYGGYRIFEESGLIQLDQRYPFDKIYVEYNGFISKINGQYYVPMVAFETLVEWTKWKQVQNKMNVSNQTIAIWRQNYLIERSNMMKNLGKTSLSQVIQSLMRLPKFDWDYGDNQRDNWYGCFNQQAGIMAATVAATVSAANPECCSTNTFINRTSFVLSVRAGEGIGNPTPNTSVYQNNILIGATDLAYILLAKQVLTVKDGDFTFNSSTGEIDISPNQFFSGDSLIANYNKIL